MISINGTLPRSESNPENQAETSDNQNESHLDMQGVRSDRKITSPLSEMSNKFAWSELSNRNVGHPHHCHSHMLMVLTCVPFDRDTSWESAELCCF